MTLPLRLNLRGACLLCDALFGTLWDIMGRWVRTDVT
jgi:hypothetical protein